MNSFDDIIKQKADSHEAPVPPAAWDNIIKKKKKRRFVFFWWIIALLLTGLGIAGYYNYSNEKKIAEINISKNEKSTIPAKDNAVSTTSAGTEDIKDNKDDKRSSDKVAIDEQQQQTLKNDEFKNSTSNNKKVNEENLTADNKTNDALLQKKQLNNSLNNISNTAALIKKKNRSSADKNYNKPAPTIKKENENNDVSFVKNNQVKKQKGKTLVSIKTAETGSTASEEIAKNNDEPINNKIIKIEDLKNTAGNDKTEADKSPQSKKDLAVDSISKKDVATTPTENKKEKRSDNKQSKQHPWFIDVAVSPVFPIQQYDRSVSFSRSSVLNNDLSEFSGKLVSTSIDPSIAFSIALRKKLNKKITVGTGLQYVQLKEHIHIAGTEKNTITTIVDKLVDGATGPMLVSDTIKTITEGNRQVNATNSYQFISIPVFIQYNFIQTRSWSLDVIGGTYITVNSRYKNEINRNATALLISSSQSSMNKNNISMALYGGIRVGKMLSKRFELFGIPSMSWNLGQQNIKNSLMNKKIQQAGISFGLSYRLN